jgi:hypothetical protein
MLTPGSECYTITEKFLLDQNSNNLTRCSWADVLVTSGTTPSSPSIWYNHSRIRKLLSDCRLVMKPYRFSFVPFRKCRIFFTFDTRKAQRAIPLLNLGIDFAAEYWRHPKLPAGSIHARKLR